MSKNKPPVKKKAPPVTLKTATIVPWYQNQLYIQIILAAIAFIFYSNSLFNEYALDDIISITGNSFTKKGFAGIPDLLNKDSMYGFIGNPSELSGGRWRPLALISFAIEYQFFGGNPHISHFINIALYSIIAVLLFRLLYQYIFKNNLAASAIATLLFVIHPVHTEVIANIKSRDELLSLFLLLLSLLFALDYFYKGKQIINIFISLLFYFLALLSKENGLTFIFILPVLFFVVSKDTILKAAIKAIPFIVVAGLYMGLRFKVIHFVNKPITEVMNAPFLYATPMQALATKIYILLLYIKLLVFPYPLSYDYSYNQIPYVDFGNIWVIISLVVYGGLLVYAFINIFKKDVLSFGILFYLFSIFIVSNLVVDVGGTMGERFLFQASIGFSICVTVLLMKVGEKFSPSSRKTIAFSFLAILVVLTGYECFLRNMVWKNDKILMSTDVYTCPNSARTNNGAGTAFILLSDDVKNDTTKRNALLDTAIVHLHTALKIHPKYVDPMLNLGVVYNRKGDAYKAEQMWNKARERDANNPQLKQYEGILATMFFNKGNTAGTKKDYPTSIKMYSKASEYNPNNPDIWYNLGGAYFSAAKYDSAQYAWAKCLSLKPDHEQAKKGMDAVKILMQRKQ